MLISINNFYQYYFYSLFNSYPVCLQNYIKIIQLYFIYFYQGIYYRFIALLYKALYLQVIYKNYNPFYIIELCKYSSNISIFFTTIYRELFKYSLLADNIFIEKLYYTLYIFILKGLSFHLSRYILLSNSQVSKSKTA